MVEAHAWRPAARRDRAVAVSRARHCGVPGEALEHVTVIGDTPLDIECARAGSAFAIAVATGGHSVEELQAAGADVVFEDLSDTEQVVAALETAAGRQLR